MQGHAKATPSTSISAHHRTLPSPYVQAQHLHRSLPAPKVLLKRLEDVPEQRPQPAAELVPEDLALPISEVVKNVNSRLHTIVRDACHMSVEHAFGRVSSLPPGMLLTLPLHMSVLHHQPSDAWVQSYLKATEPHVAKLSSSQLLSLVTALVNMQCSLTPSWLNSVYTAVLSKVQHSDAQTLARLILMLPTLQHTIPRNLLVYLSNNIFPKAHELPSSYLIPLTTYLLKHSILPPPSWLDHYASPKAFQQQSTPLSPTVLLTMATTLSACSYTPSSNWLHQWYASIHPHLPSLPTSDLLLIATSLHHPPSAIPHPHIPTPSWLKTFCTSLQPHLTALSPAQLDTLLCFLSPLTSKPDPSWLASFCKACQPMLLEYTPQQLTNLSSFLATSSFSPAASFTMSYAAAVFQSSNRFSSTQISALLPSAALIGLQPSRKWVDRILICFLHRARAEQHQAAEPTHLHPAPGRASSMHDAAQDASPGSMGSASCTSLYPTVPALGVLHVLQALQAMQVKLPWPSVQHLLLLISPVSLHDSNPSQLISLAATSLSLALPSPPAEPAPIDSSPSSQPAHPPLTPESSSSSSTTNRTGSRTGHQKQQATSKPHSKLYRPVKLDPPCNSLLQPWLQAYTSAITSYLPSISPDHLSSVLQFLASFHLPAPTPFLQAAAAHQLASLPSAASPSSLPCTLCAFATLCHNPGAPWTHCVTQVALNNLPSLSPADVCNLLKSLAQLDAPARPEWLKAFTSHCQDKLQTLSPQQLSSLVNALVKLDHTPSTPWLQAYMQAVRTQLPHMSHGQVDDMLSSLLRLQSHHLPDAVWLQQWCGSMCSELQYQSAARMRGVSHVLVIHVVRLVASFQYQPSNTWWRQTASLIEKSIGRFTAHDLTILLRSLASINFAARHHFHVGKGGSAVERRLGDVMGDMDPSSAIHGIAALGQLQSHRPPLALLDAALCQVQAAPGAVSPGDLALLLVNLTQWQHPPSKPWVEAVVEHNTVFERSCSPADLPTILWGLAVLRRPPGKEWMERVEAMAVDRLELFTADGLCELLWSYGELGYTPSPHTLDAISTQLTHHCLSTGHHLPCTALDVLDSPLLSSKEPPCTTLSPPSPSTIVCGLHGLARLQCQPAAGFLEATAVCLLPAVDDLDGASLVSLLWAYEKLKWSPGSQNMEGICAALLLHMDCMTPNCLVTALKALSGLSHKPSSIWMKALVSRAGWMLPELSPAQLQDTLCCWTQLGGAACKLLTAAGTGSAPSAAGSVLDATGTRK